MISLPDSLNSAQQNHTQDRDSEPDQDALDSQVPSAAVKQTVSGQDAAGDRAKSKIGAVEDPVYGARHRQVDESQQLSVL